MTLHHSTESGPTKSACSRHMKSRFRKKGHRRSAFRIYAAGKPSSDDQLVPASCPAHSKEDDVSPEALASEAFDVSSDWARMNFHLPVDQCNPQEKQTDVKDTSPWKSITSWRKGKWSKQGRGNSATTNGIPATKKPTSPILLDAQLRQVS